MRVNKVAGAVAVVCLIGISQDSASGLPNAAKRQQPGITYSDVALTYKVASEYSTATAIVPRMYGSAVQDSTPGRYVYSYTLVNEAASTNTISAFALNPASRPISVTGPSHWQWTFGYQLEDSALYFDSDPDDQPAPPNWDGVSILRSIYDLAPGDSLTFSFVSDRAPIMTLFYLQGFYQDSVSTESNAKAFPISIWNNSVIGTVVGPGTTTAVPGSDGGQATPGAPQLKAPAPNPSPSSATVAFYLPNSATVRLGVYQVSGRLVRTLAEGSFPPGLHSVTWNGLMASGQRAGTGVYFFKLTVDGKTAGGRKMVIIR